MTTEPVATITPKSTAATVHNTLWATNTQNDVIVSARRKTAIWTDKEDPDHFERGALVCHPVDTETGAIIRTKILIIDKDLQITLTSNTPIQIHEPAPCKSLEPLDSVQFSNAVEVEDQGCMMVDDPVVDGAILTGNLGHAATPPVEIVPPAAPEAVADIAPAAWTPPGPPPPVNAEWQYLAAPAPQAAVAAPVQNTTTELSVGEATGVAAIEVASLEETPDPAAAVPDADAPQA
jgi:hypothetical protein